MHHLTVRIDTDLHKQLTALAKRRSTTLSDSVRDLIETGISARERIAELESKLHAIHRCAEFTVKTAEELKEMREQLIESQRVPSFREFRARALAERWHLPDDALRATIECARLYYSQYKVWPNPAIAHRFGTAIEGFPAQPPRD